MKKFFKSIVSNFIFPILLASVIVAGLFRFVIFSCEISGNSMFPYLYDNDRGYSYRIGKENVNRFDICIIKIQEQEKNIVKRLIGLPNETVEYLDNKLYINGEYIEEDFLNETTTDDFYIELEDDEYFFLGDNRTISADSRYYGPFSMDDILSRGLFVVYPFSHFGAK